MDKLENKNNQVSKKISVSDTKTSTTIFLLPALGLDKDRLNNNGFINCYYGDQGHDVEYENSLYLLFKNVDSEKFEELNKYIEERHKILDTYDIQDYTMIVIKFPVQFIKEYKHFKEGKYSKFSKLYINSFFPFKKPKEWDSKGKIIKEEYTLFYHIFNKTDWLKDWWTKRLGYDDMKEFELEEWWNKPHDKEEVFRYKNDNND